MIIREQDEHIRLRREKHRRQEEKEQEAHDGAETWRCVPYFTLLLVFFGFSWRFLIWGKHHDGL
jgi:hypothetical protein